MELSPQAITSLVVLTMVYAFLISEKVNKAVVTVSGGLLLIALQVFANKEMSSQEAAFHYVSNNLDVLGFLMGMMILIGIVRESGVFEAVAIALVKAVQGSPRKLLAVFGYLALFMTMFLSNIPTILILTPIVIVLFKELKLPALPYLMTMITMANIGGAATPISDPTTYYQAKTVGLGFFEVISNSGIAVLMLSVIVTIYTQLIFGSHLKSVIVNPLQIKAFKPAKYIKDKRKLMLGVPLVILTIFLVVVKGTITSLTGLSLDNATIILISAFLSIVLFNVEMKKVFYELIDWEILFFFMGLFVVVGAVEHTGLINLLAGAILKITNGNPSLLLFIITMASCVLSTFIDNVPYNITMVSAILAMKTAGVEVYPLWWALNLGTSIGGAGSPIGAACNVACIGQAEKEHFHIGFGKYMKYAFPLVIINGLITFGFFWLRYH